MFIGLTSTEDGGTELVNTDNVNRFAMLDPSNPHDKTVVHFKDGGKLTVDEDIKSVCQVCSVPFSKIRPARVRGKGGAVHS